MATGDMAVMEDMDAMEATASMAITRAMEATEATAITREATTVTQTTIRLNDNGNDSCRL